MNPRELTPYEIYQLQTWGNILPEPDQEPDESYDDSFQIYPIELNTDSE